MSIEKTLERIADALETIAAGGGGVAPAAEPEKKPAKPSKPKKDKKEETTTVGKEAEDDGITKEQVREALQAVQKETTPAQAKSILKAEGATTIGNLAKSKYAAVIAACEKILG